MIFFPDTVAGASPSSIYFPVTKNMMRKYSHLIYSFHAISKPRNFYNLIKNENKRNITISGASYFSKAEFKDNIFYANFGRSSKYYCIFLVKGKSLVHAFGDLYTIPDNSGQKWVDYERLFLGFPDEYMTQDVITLHAQVTRAIQKFYEMFMKKVRSVIPHLEGLEQSSLNSDFMENIHSKTRKKIEYFIKMYILGCEKIIDKYIEEFNEFRKMAVTSMSTTEHFAENLVSDYTIMKAFFYHNGGHIAGNRKEVSKALSTLKGKNIDYKEYVGINGSDEMWYDFVSVISDVKTKNKDLL